MNFSADVLLWGLLFSSIGVGFFIYGKKQHRIVPLCCGLVLMVYPYAVDSVFWLVIIGVLFTAVPYFMRGR